MIKIISFDLDGTLVKNTYADRVWLEGFPKLYAKEKMITVNEAKKLLFREYDKVGMDKKEWYDIDWWFKRFKIKEDWRELLSSYRYHIHAFPETKKILSSLSKKYKLIIVSNAKREFIDIQICETNLEAYFDHVFSSLSDFDSVKKIPDVYEQVCKILNVQVNEIIHIGDNKEFDFLSPHKIGIRSFYLNRDRTETGDNVVNTLSDFEKIFG
jgi:putative hydrolase of the HAD superfamily